MTVTQPDTTPSAREGLSIERWSATSESPYAGQDPPPMFENRSTIGRGMYGTGLAGSLM